MSVILPIYATVVDSTYIREGTGHNLYPTISIQARHETCIKNDEHFQFPLPEWSCGSRSRDVPSEGPAWNVADGLNLSEYVKEIERAQDRTTEKLRELLNESKAEAEANPDDFVPFTLESEIACGRLISLFATRCFHAESVSSIASFRTNGGATFACRNSKNKRRIDVEIEPSGSTSEFAATENARPVSAFKFDLKEEVFEAWLDWLLDPEQTCA